MTHAPTDWQRIVREHAALVRFARDARRAREAWRHQPEMAIAQVGALLARLERDGVRVD